VAETTETDVEIDGMTTITIVQTRATATTVLDALDLLEPETAAVRGTIETVAKSVEMTVATTPASDSVAEMIAPLTVSMTRATDSVVEMNPNAGGVTAERGMRGSGTSVPGVRGPPV